MQKNLEGAGEYESPDCENDEKMSLPEKSTPKSMISKRLQIQLNDSLYQSSNQNVNINARFEHSVPPIEDTDEQAVEHHQNTSINKSMT